MTRDQPATWPPVGFQMPTTLDGTRPHTAFADACDRRLIADVARFTFMMEDGVPVVTDVVANPDVEPHDLSYISWRKSLDFGGRDEDGVTVEDRIKTALWRVGTEEFEQVAQGATSVAVDVAEGSKLHEPMLKLENRLRDAQKLADRSARLRQLADEVAERSQEAALAGHEY